QRTVKRLARQECVKITSRIRRTFRTSRIRGEFSSGKERSRGEGQLVLIAGLGIARPSAERGAVHHDRTAGPQQPDPFDDEIWLVGGVGVYEDQVVGL